MGPLFKRVFPVVLSIVLAASLCSAQAFATTGEPNRGTNEIVELIGSKVGEYKNLLQQASTYGNNSVDEGKGTAIIEPKRRFTVEKKYAENQIIPNFEQTIESDGHEYYLVGVDDPQNDLAYLPVTQYYEQHYTSDVPLEDIDRLDKYFPSTVHINDGLFVGDIGFKAQAFSVENIYESFSGQVDKSHTIDGLPDNDVVRLPKQMGFEVRCDSAFGATKTLTLDMLSVEYVISETNSLGLPIKYVANMVFRGEESWLELNHYHVTANYGAEIASSEKHYTILGHYELAKDPVVTIAPQLMPTALAKPNITSGAPANMTAFIVGTALAIIAALVLFLYWLFVLRKNAQLVRIEDKKRKVLIRRYLHVADAKTTFLIPDDIELLEKPVNLIELRPRLASKAGVITVEWRGKILAREELQPQFAIGSDVIKGKAVIAALTDELISASVMAAEL